MPVGDASCSSPHWSLWQHDADQALQTCRVLASIVTARVHSGKRKATAWCLSVELLFPTLMRLWLTSSARTRPAYVSVLLSEGRYCSVITSAVIFYSSTPREDKVPQSHPVLRRFRCTPRKKQEPLSEVEDVTVS